MARTFGDGRDFSSFFANPEICPLDCCMRAENVTRPFHAYFLQFRRANSTVLYVSVRLCTLLFARRKTNEALSVFHSHFLQLSARKQYVSVRFCTFLYVTFCAPNEGRGEIGENTELHVF